MLLLLEAVREGTAAETGGQQSTGMAVSVVGEGRVYLSTSMRMLWAPRRVSQWVPEAQAAPVPLAVPILTLP